MNAQNANMLTMQTHVTMASWVDISFSFFFNNYTLRILSSMALTS